MKTLAAILGLLAVFQQPTLQVDTRLQQLIVTVRDSSGNIVRHLRSQDFRIEENGVPQPIAFFTEGTDEHVSLGILIDISGSMQARSGGMTRLTAAEGTANVLMRMMKPQDEFMLMTFDDSMGVNRKFTTDPESLEAALRKLKTGGGTNLFGAVSAALKKMREAKYRKRALILITDGLSGGDLKSLAREIRDSEVKVYTFALGSKLNEPGSQIPFSFPLPTSRPGFTTSTQDILKTIADESGGRSEFFDVGDLDGAIHSMVEFDRVIAAEMRGQYTLAYYPKDPEAAVRVRPNIDGYTLTMRRVAMERLASER